MATSKLVIKTVIFTVLVPGAVVVGVPYVLLSSGPTPGLGAPLALRVTGVLPALAGVGIYLWCAWDFISAGRGTPNPFDPPKLLVSRGLYRWTRNPMYLGVALIIASEALLCDSALLLGYAALVWLLFHLRVVFYEERVLHRTFGASYAAYCDQVPRWVPRLPATRARI